MQSISWNDRGGARWIELVGELDGAACLDLRERFREAVASSDGEVVVMMQGVTFIASAAAALLVDAHKALVAQGRKLKVTGVQPPVMKAFRMMALDKVFEQI